MLCNTAAPPATSVQFQFRVSTANIQRKTYFMGSQAIVTRVSGDPDGNNGLFYIHSDHPSTGSGQAWVPPA